MPVTQINGRDVHVDDEGFLTEYDEWDEDLAKVLAVSRAVLCDENDLLYTIFGKVSSLFDDRTKSARAKTSAHRRNRAKRARTVTSFCDLYKRGVPVGRTYPRTSFIIKIRRGLIADRPERQLSSVELIVGCL